MYPNFSHTVFFITIFILIVFSNQSYNQTVTEVSPYLKIHVSNVDPYINEIVKFKAECTAPYDLDNAIIYFQIYPEDAAYEDSIKLEEGKELISGETTWQGAVKGGETVIKEISIRFSQPKVFLAIVGFRLSLQHTGLNKLFKIYVGGAFEEDERVRRMRIAIEWCKEELISPHPNPFMPDTSTFDPSDLDDFIKQFDSKELLKLKPETRLNDKENIRKNDNLLLELRKEYESLMKQVNDKRFQERKNKGKSQGMNIINDDPVQPSDLNLVIIKNCASQALWFVYTSNGNTALMTNWRVSPCMGCMDA